MNAPIQQLLDEYLRLYASRDHRLTEFFSENFSGFTGGGNFLVKDLEQWIAITRQDFAQVKDPIRIELKDLTLQQLSESVAVATSFFTIHLPIKDHVLSRETARLVLIFRKEPAGWKIAHSSISIPYHLVQEGEVYPLKQLMERNQLLEKLVAERTAQLSEANTKLRQTNEQLEREVAERKVTERSLLQSEQRYRSILNASPDDITITDLEGHIVMVSPAARTMFGFDQDEDFKRRQLSDFLLPEEWPRALAQIAEKRKGLSTGPTEYRARHRDGHIFDIEVNSEFIRDETGTPTGLVVIVRDVTQRKQAEVEQRKLEAQNRQLLKAESLTRMAGAIAHHFNNQLQAVMMGLDLASGELPRKSEAAEFISDARRSAHRAAEMSSLMLTYLGHTIVTPQPLDLAKICNQELALLSVVMPRQATLKLDLPDPGPSILADPKQIETILRNLMTNAWEASGAAPSVIHVTVKTTAAAEISAAHRFPVDSQPPDNAHACLEVSDSGCGIPAKEIEKIFDPFYSTKFLGRGLGLAVALGIVRSLDGIITVESEPGRGSVFRIILPLSAER
jgi:PAS domain S-box-containing protein